MKINKCPSCGYVMKDGITRYACPKCGCSADSFISIGDSEATSSISAPSAWRQNRGTGDNISNQPTKKICNLGGGHETVISAVAPAEFPERTNVRLCVFILRSSNHYYHLN